MKKYGADLTRIGTQRWKASIGFEINTSDRMEPMWALRDLSQMIEKPYPFSMGACEPKKCPYLAAFSALESIGIDIYCDRKRKFTAYYSEDHYVLGDPKDDPLEALLNLTHAMRVNKAMEIIHQSKVNQHVS